MSILVLAQGSLSFSGQAILDQVSLNIDAGEKIGLMGPNGSGKSTLFRVLMGQQQLDSGQVVRTKGCRAGYLPQDILDVTEGTVLGSVLASVPGKADLEQELDRVNQRLEQATQAGQQLKLAQRLALLGERLELFEAQYDKYQAMRILKGLGFEEGDLPRPTRELSGGWKMRAALAGLLFQQPDVLLLDEPTNHLDLPSVLWLNKFLLEYPKAMVLVCHDRPFFNRHVQRVISFEPEGVRFYSGNYDEYLEIRGQEEEVLSAENRKREKKIKELDRFVERFRAKATKARQAQSRAKQIERLQRDVERPVQRLRSLQFRFPPTERTGRDVLMVEELSKSFGPLSLYQGLTRAIHAGDRVAIIGPNGKGKSTLLKMMAGELAPDSGRIRLGSHVKPGYFAQHHTEQLDRGRSVLQEVWSQKPNSGESLVRGICGAFLFSGDDVEKAVGVLSGGERARVLLARLLINPGNLLLLDEPTTHLDMAASEALVEALDSYDGTLVFISHNMALLERLPTRIWDIDRDGVQEYPGNFAEYLEHLERREEGVTPGPAAGETRQRPPKQTPDASERTRQGRQQRKRQEAEQRNALSRKTRKLRKTIEEVEQKIESLEEEKDALEPELADPSLYEDASRSRRIVERYEELRRKLERCYWQWEEAQNKLERIIGA